MNRVLKWEHILVFNKFQLILLIKRLIKVLTTKREREEKLDRVISYFRIAFIMSTLPYIIALFENDSRNKTDKAKTGAYVFVWENGKGWRVMKKFYKDGKDSQNRGGEKRALWKLYNARENLRKYFICAAQARLFYWFYLVYILMAGLLPLLKITLLGYFKVLGWSQVF